MSKFVKPEVTSPPSSVSEVNQTLQRSNTTTNASSQGDSRTHNGYRLPCPNTLWNAIKLSIVEDKPILMDYWTVSIDKTAIIGVKEDEEKLLVKSDEEYTSPIDRIYNVEKDYIIITENSIYLVDSTIPKKKISSLQ